MRVEFFWQDHSHEGLSSTGNIGYYLVGIRAGMIEKEEAYRQCMHGATAGNGNRL